MAIMAWPFLQEQNRYRNAHPEGSFATAAKLNALESTHARSRELHMTLSTHVPVIRGNDECKDKQSSKLTWFKTEPRTSAMTLTRGNHEKVSSIRTEPLNHLYHHQAEAPTRKSKR